jgi:hypothetical protein
MSVVRSNSATLNFKPLSSIAFGRRRIELAKHCARKTGNIGYTPHYQQLNWQHNQQHIGNTRYIVDLQQLPHT